MLACILGCERRKLRPEKGELHLQICIVRYGLGRRTRSPHAIASPSSTILCRTHYPHKLRWHGASQDPDKTLTITGCVFGWNSVEGEGEGFGGAVVANGGVVYIHNTVFQGNRGELCLRTITV